MKPEHEWIYEHIGGTAHHIVFVEQNKHRSDTLQQARMSYWAYLGLAMSYWAYLGLAGAFGLAGR